MLFLFQRTVSIYFFKPVSEICLRQKHIFSLLVEFNLYCTAARSAKPFVYWICYNWHTVFKQQADFCRRLASCYRTKNMVSRITWENLLVKHIRQCSPVSSVMPSSLSIWNSSRTIHTYCSQSESVAVNLIMITGSAQLLLSVAIYPIIFYCDKELSPAILLMYNINTQCGQWLLCSKQLLRLLAPPFTHFVMQLVFSVCTR